MPLHKNQSIRLAVEALSSDGNGVGHCDGQAVFVPGAAVGDVLQVTIVKAAKRYAYGRLQQVVTAGPGRQREDCPLSRPCGGCDFRHLTYEVELAAKRQFVQDALQRIGHLEAEVLPTLPSPVMDRYRNKVQVPVAPAAGGGLVYGFYAGRSHRILPYDDCLLQPRGMNRIVDKTVALLAAAAASGYDEATRKGLVRHVALRRAASGDVLVCIVATSFALPGAQNLVAELTGAFAEIKTIVVNKNADNTNVIFGRESRALYGDGFICDELCGVPARLNEHTFWQVNSPAASQLFAVAAHLAAPSGDTVLLDLYCGTGVIGLSMAGRCRQMIGVEVVPAAVDSAVASAAQMGLSNTRFLCADAGGAARQLAAEGLRPDVVVVDPPRRGMDDAARSAVAAMAPQRIVMVSCNAATLARDAADFAARGYHLRQVQPADLFPRTKHVESVALLERGSPV